MLSPSAEIKWFVSYFGKVFGWLVLQPTTLLACLQIPSLPLFPFRRIAFDKNIQKTLFTQTKTQILWKLSRDDLYQRKSVLEIQDVPGWKSRKSLFTFSIFFGLGWSEQNTLDALLVKHFKVRATKHKSQPVTFERDPAGVFPLTLALFTHSQSFHHTFLIIWH